MWLKCLEGALSLSFWRLASSNITSISQQLTRKISPLQSLEGGKKNSFSKIVFFFFSCMTWQQNSSFGNSLIAKTSTTSVVIVDRSGHFWLSWHRSFQFFSVGNFCRRYLFSILFSSLLFSWLLDWIPSRDIGGGSIRFCPFSMGPRFYSTPLVSNHWFLAFLSLRSFLLGWLTFNDSARLFASNLNGKWLKLASPVLSLTLRDDPSLGVNSEATVPNIEGWKISKKNKWQSIFYQATMAKRNKVLSKESSRG